MVDVEALPNVEADNGWTVLTTILRPEVCSGAGILQAYHEQHTTVVHAVVASLVHIRVRKPANPCSEAGKKRSWRLIAMSGLWGSHTLPSRS